MWWDSKLARVESMKKANRLSILPAVGQILSEYALCLRIPLFCSWAMYSKSRVSIKIWPMLRIDFYSQHQKWQYFLLNLQKLTMIGCSFLLYGRASLHLNLSSTMKWHSSDNTLTAEKQSHYMVTDTTKNMEMGAPMFYQRYYTYFIMVWYWWMTVTSYVLAQMPWVT